MLFNGDGPTRLSRDCSLVSERRLDAAIVRLYGEFDLACEERFQEELGRLVDEATAQLVLDLRGLTFMDSIGLRMLISLDAIAKTDGFGLSVVCAAEGPVRTLLVETGLDDVLPIVERAPQTDSSVET
jgi:anti-sigma B factor antagonist